MRRAWKNKIIVLICLFTGLSSIQESWAQKEIKAVVNSDRTSELSNGIVSMTINSKGQVNYFALNAKDLVNAANKGRFYFSYNSADYHELSPTTARLARLSDELAEVIYTNTSGEFIIEQAFVLLKDVPGVYCYVTLKANSTSRIKLREMRIVYRVDSDIFTYAYVSDQTQGRMVSPEELQNVEEIMDATYLLDDGSIYTKYDWANYVDDDIVHGLCNDAYGIWVVSSSDEYLNGGPMKQELMVHGTSKTPLILKMLQGEHFGAAAQFYEKGEEKIYGPFLLYANEGLNKQEIIQEAKAYATQELSKWPYEWMQHDLYPLDRSMVSGTLKVSNQLSPENMMVVLAQPGKMLYDQGKDYMFWSKADSSGSFNINNVRQGNYSLYVFATEGEMTGEIEISDIEVAGEETNLGELEITPEKHEHLLWRIGESDRTARGFKLADRRRAYGLWDSVQSNLTYTIESSVPEEDWYYAQTKPGNWDINFNLDRTYNGTAYLTLGIAGAANGPQLVPYVNGSRLKGTTFSNDASVYRSANQGGKYTTRTFKFNADKLQEGQNTIRLQLTSVGNRGGLIYDVIKLEVGDEASGIVLNDDREKNRMKVYPNPFSSELQVAVHTVGDESAEILLLDQTGRKLQTIFSGMLNAGIRKFTYSGSELQSGIYFIQYSSTKSYRITKIVKN